jgi:hypothetical protein
VASITRYLVSTGLGLWALMMALQPDVGFVAPWPFMAVFWALQIAAGLAVLQWVLYALSRADRSGRAPPWLLVIVSGVCGSAVLAPVYWLIGEGLMEKALGFPVAVQDGDDPGPALAFGWPALLDEVSEIVGPITSAWALISWPRLPGLLPPLLWPSRSGPDAPQQAPLNRALDQAPNQPINQPINEQPNQPPDEPRSEAIAGPDTAPDTGPDTAPDTAPVQQDIVIRPQPAWRAGLPQALGDDLIAVASELQYLRVWTTRGCALVLGSLQDVDDQEGTSGMRVHRSWWVHARHVRSVRRGSAGAVCELSDGRDVPVSRRRKAEVLARFGDGVRYEAPRTASPPSPDVPHQKTRRSPT